MASPCPLTVVTWPRDGPGRPRIGRPAPNSRTDSSSAPGHCQRLLAGAAAPSPGGCRRAEGGTPDPCHRDHPARPGVKLERPQAARHPTGPSQLDGSWRPRTNELDAGDCRAGWYSRRVRASAQRGRVQGPGRAEADFGPRTVSVALFPEHNSWSSSGTRYSDFSVPGGFPGWVPGSPH
jgi:hypothetical protein